MLGISKECTVPKNKSWTADQNCVICSFFHQPRSSYWFHFWGRFIFNVHQPQAYRAALIALA